MSIEGYRPSVAGIKNIPERDHRYRPQAALANFQQKN